MSSSVRRVTERIPVTSFDGNVLKPVNSWTVTMAVLIPVRLSFNVLFVDIVRYSHRDWIVWVASSIVLTVFLLTPLFAYPRSFDVPLLRFLYGLGAVFFAGPGYVGDIAIPLGLAFLCMGAGWSLQRMSRENPESIWINELRLPSWGKGNYLDPLANHGMRVFYGMNGNDVVLSGRQVHVLGTDDNSLTVTSRQFAHLLGPDFWIRPVIVGERRGWTDQGNPVAPFDDLDELYEHPNFLDARAMSVLMHYHAKSQN